ncbi:MAG: ABC transporter substrate-binding protein, partial [Oscillospiraceae bacterium]
GTMNLVQAVYLNNAEKPFDDIKVRQALSYAIDRNSVMAFLADGKGAGLGSSMYPSFAKYFNPKLTDYYSFDPEKAKTLLAEAGYPEGFEMTITVPSNFQPHIDTAEIIAEQLKAIGVSAKVELVDWDSWLTNVYTGRKYQSTIVGVDAANLTARAMLERFTSDAGNNFVNFKNTEYDETFKKAIAATDDAAQTKLYGRMQEILTEDAANLYIQDLCDLVAMGKNVGGYEFYPLYVMDMSKVYFTK